MDGMRRPEDMMRRRQIPGGMDPYEEAPLGGRIDQEQYTMGARMAAEELAANAAGPKLGGVQADVPAAMGARKITKERIKKANQDLLDYKGKKSSIDNRVVAAQQWWKLKNWQQISEDHDIHGSTTDKRSTGWLWNCIVGKHADAIDSYPEPVILPRMVDDREEAKILSDVVPVVMEMNGFEEVYSDCAWQKMQEGTGVYSVMWDKDKMGGMGDISIKKVNILNLFWEPGVQDIQDSRNVFYISLVDNDLLQKQYPQLVGKLNGTNFVVTKYQTDDAVRIDNKSCVVDWYYHTYDGGKKQLHFCKYVGEEVLYSTEEMGQPLYDDGLYPFVLDPLFPVAGSPCGYGYIDIGKDCQTDIDVMNEAMVLNTIVGAVPRYFFRKDGGINMNQFVDWYTPLIECNGNLGADSVLPVQTPKLDGNTLNMYQAKIEELKFITGNTDVNNGGAPAGVTAASAIAALKEDSGRSSKDSTKAAYRAYRKIVTMVIERIRQFYDIPRYFRITGESGVEQFMQFSNEGLKEQPMMNGLGLQKGYRLPVFDIDVRAQRENAYTKMSQNELALQFFNLGFFNPTSTDQVLMCLEMMDFKGKDEIQQKIRENGTMADALTQVGNIALELAQRYQPEVADQLAMTLQGIAGMIGAGSPAGPGAEQQIKKPTAATKSNDALANANDAKEHPIVRTAKERAASAARPD